MNHRECECPYCGEINTIIREESNVDYTVVQDCYICCNPILIEIIKQHNSDDIVIIRSEND